MTSTPDFERKAAGAIAPFLSVCIHKSESSWPLTHKNFLSYLIWSGNLIFLWGSSYKTRFPSCYKGKGSAFLLVESVFDNKRRWTESITNSHSMFSCLLWTVFKATANRPLVLVFSFPQIKTHSCMFCVRKQSSGGTSWLHSKRFLCGQGVNSGQKSCRNKSFDHLSLYQASTGMAMRWDQNFYSTGEQG